MFKCYAKVAGLIIKVSSFFLAGYMIVQQIQRFVGNLDVSTITLQQFHNHKGDEYPTFTFCLEDKKWAEHFNTTYFANRTIGESDYQMC